MHVGVCVLERAHVSICVHVCVLEGEHMYVSVSMCWCATMSGSEIVYITLCTYLMDVGIRL